MDKILIQSIYFDAETYLRVVHQNTGMAQMKSYLRKLEEETKQKGKDETRVKLVIDNYDSFLEAKLVLDNLNTKFVESKMT